LQRGGGEFKDNIAKKKKKEKKKDGKVSKTSLSSGGRDGKNEVQGSYCPEKEKSQSSGKSNTNGVQRKLGKVPYLQ